MSKNSTNKKKKYVVLVMTCSILISSFFLSVGSKVIISSKDIKPRNTVNVTNGVCGKNGINANDVNNSNDSNIGVSKDNKKKVFDIGGYSKKEVEEVKDIFNEVINQLKEITSNTNSVNNDSVSSKPQSSPDAYEEKDKEDIDKYKELEQKIDLDAAIYFMLKLKRDFGSYQSALDEYLCSLQLNIDLNEYITNKKIYKKKKEEKLKTTDETKIITIEKIQEKSLTELQKENKKDDTPNNTDSTSVSDKGNENVNKVEVPNPQMDNLTENKLPEDIVPKAQETRPANPQEEVMKEINNLKDKSLNNEYLK